MQYLIIDMANIQPQAVRTVDRAFDLWKSVYKYELESRGQTFHEEHFWNCRILAVIEQDGEIIGTHIYNVFHLDTLITKNHPYFLDIPDLRLQDFKNHQVHQIMSMEYLLVNPAHRGRNAPVRWAEVVIGLGLKVMLHSPWDGIVGIAREDKKVNQMGMKMGVLEMDGLMKNQTPCRIMFLSKSDLKPHADPGVQTLIENLWRNRIDYSPWSHEAPEKQKRKAA